MSHSEKPNSLKENADTPAQHSQQLIDAMPGIPWVMDIANQQFSYVGSQAEALLGYPATQWYQDNFWAEHIHPDDRQTTLQQHTESLQKGHRFSLEYRMLHHNGQSIWLRHSVNINPVDTCQQQCIGFMADISLQKQLETTLQQTQTRLNDLQMMSQTGCWQLDLGKDQLEWSDEVFHIFELAPEKFSASYQGFIDVIHPDDREMVNRAYLQSLETKTPYEIEHRLLMPDGRIKHVLEHCKTTFNQTGKPLISVGTVQDISQRKLLQIALEQQHRNLETLVEQRTMALKNTNQELESFSYSVSHDLRSPLRHIHGFSQILQEDYQAEIDESGQKLLTRICDNTAHMGELIESLLQLSRVSRAPLKREQVDLSLMAKTIFDTLRAEAPERSVEISIQPKLSAYADPELSRSLLANLINNAWKYSAKKELAKISVETTTDETGLVVFFVRDNGAGFDMQYAGKLFTAFQRLHSDSEFKGTGIGLATARRIVHRHGGKIWTEAEPKKGACFYFSLGNS
jgi:PAS domain S-box-containing protein